MADVSTELEPAAPAWGTPDEGAETGTVDAEIVDDDESEPDVDDDVVDAEIVEEEVEAGTEAEAEETPGAGSVPHSMPSTGSELPKSEPAEKSHGGNSGRGGGGFGGLASRGQKPVNISFFPVHLAAHFNMTNTLAVASANNLAALQVSTGASVRRPRSGRRRPRRD